MSRLFVRVGLKGKVDELSACFSWCVETLDVRCG